MPEGLDVGGRILVLQQLEDELVAGGVTSNGLVYMGPGHPVDLSSLPPPELPAGCRLFGHDAEGNLADLPPAAVPIVAAHVPA